MYIMTGSIGASLGSAYSFLMRIELGMPGYVLLEKNPNCTVLLLRIGRVVLLLTDLVLKGTAAVGKM